MDADALRSAAHALIAALDAPDDDTGAGDVAGDVGAATAEAVADTAVAVAEAVAEAVADAGPAPVEYVAPDPFELAVADTIRTEADAAAQVAVIEAEAAAQVAVIEAATAAELGAGLLDDDGPSLLDDVLGPLVADSAPDAPPRSGHRFFQPWGRR